MWPRSRLASSSFPLFPPSLSVESLFRPSLSSHLRLWPGYGSGARCLFYFFPVRLLSDPASEPQHTGPSHGRLAASAALSVNYALVHKKGVIVPAVCSDNERVNMSQVFWRKELTAAPQLRPPSISVCPVVSGCTAFSRSSFDGQHLSSGLLACTHILLPTLPAMDPLVRGYGSSTDHFQHGQKTQLHLKRGGKKEKRTGLRTWADRSANQNKFTKITD